jgi:hypothetical protein
MLIDLTRERMKTKCPVCGKEIESGILNMIKHDRANECKDPPIKSGPVTLQDLKDRLDEIYNPKSPPVF